jgi:hypothetical protein
MFVSLSFCLLFFIYLFIFYSIVSLCRIPQKVFSGLRSSQQIRFPHCRELVLAAYPENYVHQGTSLFPPPSPPFSPSHPSLTKWGESTVLCTKDNCHRNTGLKTYDFKSLHPYQINNRNSSYKPFAAPNIAQIKVR